ncbi:hypothetical protein [Polaribacter septentrionalilitoris]|uniref:hypothetical protein n=1 Tax=Polaribacter septentrionalilitoris TaxID=2494657 RepID=UPI00135BF3CB|nr:hypothetical protein [Polaribacter septentrionalilitoris]
MKNPFKEILTKKEVSKNLKSRVLDDVGMINLTYHFADLFLMKVPGTISDIYIGVEISEKK